MRSPIALEYFRKSTFDRFDKRSGREWLGQVGDTSCLDCGRAVRVAVIAGDENYRQSDAPIRELAPQLYAGLVKQIDVNDDAKGAIEIRTTEQRSTRIEQCYVEPMLTQEPLHALTHRRIIVHDKD
jgi:hypothetical protein